MTEKQKQRLKEKLQKIKKGLNAEKKKFGWFDDSRGTRYLPTKLYVRLRDFAGGLRYLKWFDKNFPDDVGFPDFLFESTMIFYKQGKLKEAENSALRAYFSNPFLIDVYFENEIHYQGEKGTLRAFQAEIIHHLEYRYHQEQFADFSEWLRSFVRSERFLKTKSEFDAIEKQLETEPVGPTRTKLVKKLHELI